MQLTGRLRPTARDRVGTGDPPEQGRGPLSVGWTHHKVAFSGQHLVGQEPHGVAMESGAQQPGKGLIIGRLRPTCRWRVQGVADVGA